MVVSFFQNLGMVAHSAGSVEAAFCILQEAADAGQKYNVVLLDLWLKGVDASELILMLRQRPALIEKAASSAVSRNKNVLKEVCQDFSQASNDSGGSTFMEDKESMDDQGKEIVGKHKQEPNTSGGETIIQDKSILEALGNKISFKDDLYLSPSLPTNNAGDSNIISVCSKGVPGSYGEMDQHSSGNLLHVDQSSRKVKVSSSVDDNIIVLTSVNHTDINR